MLLLLQCRRCSAVGSAVSEVQCNVGGAVSEVQVLQQAGCLQSCACSIEPVRLTGPGPQSTRAPGPKAYGPRAPGPQSIRAPGPKPHGPPPPPRPAPPKNKKTVPKNYKNGPKQYKRPQKQEKRPKIIKTSPQQKNDPKNKKNLLK